MAACLIVTLFLLPLLFISALSSLQVQVGFNGGDLESYLAGFKPQHLTTEACKESKFCRIFLYFSHFKDKKSELQYDDEMLQQHQL